MNPIPVTQLDTIFGGDMEKLLPAWDTIPEDFQRYRSTWNDIFSRWFYRGLPQGTRFIPKEGVDAKAALNHLRAIMSSFEPKHEHKEAGVAFLMSQWFESVEIPQEQTK